VIALDLRVARRDFDLRADLRLPARGVTAFFGPSGCGKTTLLRAIAGLEPARGRVAFGDSIWQDDARGVHVPTHRRPIGYVIQESALFPHLDVQGNLAYGLRRTPAAQRRIATEQVVDLLAIGHLMRRRPATLSGGERQRVAIARALATSPRLLLMDEPLAALDARRKAEVLPYLERLQRELDLPILYVSHAIDEVARLAHHLVLLERGQVLGSGALAETLARLDLPLALGDEAGVVLEAVVGERDVHWQLARLDAGGGGCQLWARDHGIALGDAVRVRVLARDVSVTREPQPATSIANQLRGEVEAVAPDSHPGLALARVRVGGTALLARLTRRSAEALALAPGVPVWTQVKTVAVIQ